MSVARSGVGHTQRHGNVENADVRSVHSPLGSIGSVDVRPAHSRDELEQAYRLVHATYCQQGYVKDSPERLRLTVFNAFPDTATFIAKDGGEVVGTVSVVGDTDIGLPMDEVHGKELRELRGAGRKLAEVTMLATKSQAVNHQLPVFLQLMKRVFDYVWFILQADDACLTCHLHHTGFYGKRLLFDRIGEETSHASGRDNAAVAMRLNFSTVEERYREDGRLWRMFFENRTSPRMLARRHRMTPGDLKYFLVKRTAICRNASAGQIEALRLLYPECPWTRWSWGFNPLRPLVRGVERIGAGLSGAGKAAWDHISQQGHPLYRPSPGAAHTTAETTMH